MDFLNKVGSTISSKGKDVTKKAKEIAEISRMTGQIAMKEESIKGVHTLNWESMCMRARKRMHLKKWRKNLR